MISTTDIKTKIHLILAWLFSVTKCERGGVLIFWSFAMIPILIGVGASVDLSRAYLAKARLEMALDAAGLAAGAGTTSEQEIADVAQEFFLANYPDAIIGTASPLDVTFDGAKITLSANVTVDTVIMRAFGHETVNVAAATEITRQGLEVVLVLDNTGSMKGSKMASLRQASQDFIDIVFQSPDLLTNLKVGVVPYSAAVNVGSQAPNLITQVGQGHYDPSDGEKWKGCVTARTNPDDVRDSSMNGGNKWSRYLWTSAADNVWTPVDTDPNSCNAGTGPNLGCPTPITPLTDDKTILDTAISDLEAWCRGGTFSNVGMVWGWRVLSPEVPFDEGLAYDTPGFNKAVILMTDGVNGYYKLPGSPFDTDYSAYGRVSEGNLGTTSKTTAKSILNSRLTTTCTNMKDEGIIIYAVTFNLNDQNTKNIYRNCATDDSKYFDSPSGADLQTAFQDIATQLINLRISK